MAAAAAVAVIRFDHEIFSEIEFVTVLVVSVSFEVSVKRWRILIVDVDD